MKPYINFKVLIASISIIFFVQSCTKPFNKDVKKSLKEVAVNNKTTSLSELHIYGQINLVSDVSGYYSETIDKTLINAWGLAFNLNGNTWVSANHTGFSTQYDIHGKKINVYVSEIDGGVGSIDGMGYYGQIGENGELQRLTTEQDVIKLVSDCPLSMQIINEGKTKGNYLYQAIRAYNNDCKPY